MHAQLLSFLVRSLPPKARNTLPTQSTAQDHFDRNLGKERDVLDRKFIPGYGGYIPRELTKKTEGGQWCPPAFLEVEAKEADTPFENLGANQPPGEGAPPRSVVFSRDGIFVEGGPAMRKAGSHLIH